MSEYLSSSSLDNTPQALRRRRALRTSEARAKAFGAVPLYGTETEERLPSFTQPPGATLELFGNGHYKNVLKYIMNAYTYANRLEGIRKSWDEFVEGQRKEGKNPFLTYARMKTETEDSEENTASDYDTLTQAQALLAEGFTQAQVDEVRAGVEDYLYEKYGPGHAHVVDRERFLKRVGRAADNAQVIVDRQPPGEQ